MARASLRDEAVELDESQPSLLVEERSASLRHFLSANVVLNAIPGPALMLSRNGEILRANASAQRALTSDPHVFDRSLSIVFGLIEPARGSTVSGDASATEPSWRIVPLQGASNGIGFLAILQPPLPIPIPMPARAVPETVRAASCRWKLTQRQGEVLELAGRGLTNELIADTLGIAKGTVEFHLRAIFDKAGVSNRATLIDSAGK
jgi:DNA-binding CsgD family transcriptional regulator